MRVRAIKLGDFKYESQVKTKYSNHQRITNAIMQATHFKIAGMWKFV